MTIHSELAANLLPNESKIHQGDAFLLAERLPEGSIDLVVTSPPYNIGKSYERGMFRSADDYKDRMAKFVGTLSRKLKNTGSVCWQVGSHVRDQRLLPLDYLFFEMFLDNGFILRNRIIWRFNFGFNAKHRFSGRYETLLWFTKTNDYAFNLDPVRVPQIYPGKTKKTAAGHQPSGNPKGKNPSDFWEFEPQEAFLGEPVWDVPNVKAKHPEKTDHPCQFPNEVADRCILAFTSSGDTILDPFAGVGTAISCAEARGRIGIGFELDGSYAKEAKERLALARVGQLVVRPSGQPPHRPNPTDKVARVPSEWQNTG